VTTRAVVLVGCLLLIALPSIADQVVLKNGDRITGEIVKKDAANLTFKSDVFGLVTLPWDKVESLSAEKPVFVVLPNNRTVLATITTKQDRVQIAAADATQDSSLADLLALRNSDEQTAYERMLNPSWTQLWAGTASLALAGAQGNAKARTFTTGFNAARVTSTDKTTVQLNAIRSSATVDGLSAATAQAIRGGWGYNRNIGSRLTWNTFNDYENDRFQNLDLRFVLGGGLGVIVWQSERGRLDLQGGGAYNRETFSASGTRPEFTRNAAEAYAGDEFTFKLSPVTSVFQSSRTFANLSRTGEYRVNFDVGTNTKLFRWLTWNASISDRYLSNPVPGRKRNDFLYSTGLGISFSR
jgi:hypothetical protein